MSGTDEVSLPTTKGATFRLTETVTLDGHHFVDCRFENCTVQFSGGPYILERCRFEGLVLFQFGEAARRCFQLLGALCDEYPEIRTQMVPNWRQWKSSPGKEN